MASFESIMAEASVLFRMGWPSERGNDPVLQHHMRLKTYGADRERTPYEVHMDTRAFNYILAHTAAAASQGRAGDEPQPAGLNRQ